MPGSEAVEDREAPRSEMQVVNDSGCIAGGVDGDRGDEEDEEDEGRCLLFLAVVACGQWPFMCASESGTC